MAKSIRLYPKHAKRQGRSIRVDLERDFHFIITETMLQMLLESQEISWEGEEK